MEAIGCRPSIFEMRLPRLLKRPSASAYDPPFWESASCPVPHQHASGGEYRACHAFIDYYSIGAHGQGDLAHGEM